jgi:anhydro-N-acetylmuramic acid kinase
MLVIGLMSGTSADASDAALVRVEGSPPDLRWEVCAHLSLPHPADLRAEILACCSPATGNVERICSLNARLGEVFADASLELCRRAGIAISEVELIGSHGQTIWHNPSGPWAGTLQIGEAAIIAERTGCHVVSNFRPRDMAAGGQGAPLIAYVDLLLLGHPHRIRVAQNIGGIANLSYIPPTGQAGSFAFDTGPGNMLIDDAVMRLSDGAMSYDTDGAIAAEGQIDQQLLSSLLAHPYLQLPPPKTTGRELFGAQFGAALWQAAQQRGMRPIDLVATLTAFTAHSIAEAYRRFLPRMPDEVIISGGGVHNTTLMEQLRELLPETQLFSSEDLGLPSDAKEAVAFALLAYETWHRRPSNYPPATGAKRSVILGDITFA